MFPFVPIDHVIIDTLHLFLRISDNLTDLLIRDLGIQDSLEKTDYLKVYEKHLNGKCKIHISWHTDQQSKELKYHDLTGPEKIRLFENITIPQLFPLLPNKEKIQSLWQEFYTLIGDINKEDCNPEEIGTKTKAWVSSFTSTYQAKDATPYMHACK